MPALVDELAHLREFAQCRWNKFLTAESWVHRHQENNIELVHEVFEAVKWRSRVKHEACFAAVVANQLQRPIDMACRLGMKRDVASPSFGEVNNHLIHRANHQVNVDRRCNTVITQRTTYHGTNGEIWHVMIVHHVEMHHIGARL